MTNAASRSRWVPWMLAVATLVAYHSVPTLGFLSYDDPKFVTSNAMLAGGVGAGTLWNAVATSSNLDSWMPMTALSYLIDRMLFGLDPAGYHVVNLLLHVIGTLFLYRALVAMTRSVWPSLFVAGVFALHPLHVESVAWISERKDVLCGAFWMLTLWCHARYVQTPSPGRYAAMGASATAAMLAKPMAVTLPFVLILLDVWPLGRIRAGADFDGRALRRVVSEKLPLLALAIAVSAITYGIQRGAGAMDYGDPIPLGTRLLNALTAYAAYVRDAFWPTRLAIHHPYADVGDLSTWAGLAAAFLLVVTGATVWQLRARPQLAVGWLWFLGTLVPVIGFVQVGSQARADRYMYVPIVGLAIAVAWLGVDASASLSGRRVEAGQRSPDGRSGPTRQTAAARAFPVLVILMLVVLGMLTVRRLRDWKDTTTLFEHALTVTRDNAVTRSILGNEALRSGDYVRAHEHFLQAKRLEPASYGAALGLGRAKLQRGDVAGAIAVLEELIGREPGRPEAYASLGRALLRARRPGEARVAIDRALALDTDAASVLAAKAELEETTGRRSEAVHFYRDALEREPLSAEYANNLAWLLATSADPAIRSPHQAMVLARRAVAASTPSQRPAMLDTLAAAYAAAGDFARAVATVDEAIALAGPGGAGPLSVHRDLFARRQSLMDGD